MMLPVLFLTGWMAYNAGEVAGFPEAEARHLIARGIAEPLSVEQSGPAREGAPPRVTKPARRTVEKGS